MCECRNEKELKAARESLNHVDIILARIRRQIMNRATGDMTGGSGEIDDAVENIITYATNAARDREFARKERNGAQERFNKELISHGETRKLLEQERSVNAMLSKRFEPTIPAVGLGFEGHKGTVREALKRYARSHYPDAVNHPKRVAEAVYFLLDRVARLEAQTGADQNAKVPRTTAPPVQEPWAPPATDWRDIP